MKQSKKDELIEETKEICKILFLAQESFKLIEYIYRNDADADIVYSKKSTFFIFSTTVYWRVIVIELCKLFSGRKNDHYNLNKFLKKLKPDGYYGDAKIDPKKIQAWEQMIAEEKDVIKNLTDLRDHEYAHSDKISTRIANNVSIAKTKEFITVIQKIVREIYLIILGSSFQVEDPVNAPVGNLEWIVDVLANEKKNREAFLKEIAESNGIHDEFN